MSQFSFLILLSPFLFFLFLGCWCAPTDARDTFLVMIRFIWGFQRGNCRVLTRAFVRCRSIRRIIFSSLLKTHLNSRGEKEMETINCSTALQIAGRAGRYGTEFETVRSSSSPSSGSITLIIRVHHTSIPIPGVPCSVQPHFHDAWRDVWALFLGLWGWFPPPRATTGNAAPTSG